MDLIRRGVRAVLRGDFSKIGDWLNEQVRVRLGGKPDVEAYRMPSWLTTPSEEAQQTIIRNTRVGGSRFEGQESEWFTVLPALSFTIRSDEKFDCVDFPVTFAPFLDTIRVTAHFKTESGEVSTDVSTFTNEDRRDVAFSVPFSVSTDRPVHEVDIDLQVQYRDSLRKVSSLFKEGKKYKPQLEAKVGQPTPRPINTTNPPIFLISVDALRFDTRADLEPLISSFGEEATIPQEPRTQGHWTPPSHASMFTGLHPGEHKFVGTYNDGWPQPIDRRATTIPELLNENMYKCSALVCNPNILPEWGFGRGFHRYELKKLDRIPRPNNDAQDQVNSLIRWIEQDLRADSHNLFYFLHILDPHTPTFPPLPPCSLSDVNVDSIFEYAEQAKDMKDYMKILDGELQIDEELVDAAKQSYDENVTYVAHQVSRLVGYLKRQGLYEDALIIVTGDHGEEFGERQFHGHNSLYDANIRPFMIIKPPLDASWTVPDRTDTIDFLPTIARIVGETPPEYCQGTPWQDGSAGSRPRITERIHWDWYNVAVEDDGVKGIFTYPSGNTERPPEDVIERGPVNEEYYVIDDIRNGYYEQRADRISPETRQSLRHIAREFVLNPELGKSNDRTAENKSVPEGVEDRLEHLGYR